jgi:hypothetical protein
MCGLAVDAGRIYITKNEAQGYSDSAALDAATKLDGTLAGLQAARDAVAASVNKWHFGTNSFTGTLVEFSKDRNTWQENPSDGADYTYVRVTATAQNLELFFLPMVGSPRNTNVLASAVAGQILTAGFTANSNSGVFPFSPISHADGVSSTEVAANDPTGNFGFTPGQFYTLRWPSNPRVTGNNVNVCAGDATDQWVTKADAGSNSERGYIQETSASAIRAAIEDDQITYSVVLNQAVTMTGGAKSTEADAIENRIAQDSDPTTNNYAQYMAAKNGNGRRVITVALNSGPRDNNGNVRAVGDQNVVVGFAQFFLTAMDYPNGGNQAFCAEYVGPGALVITQSNTGASTVGANGAYVVRLVQ